MDLVSNLLDSHLNYVFGLPETTSYKFGITKNFLKSHKDLKTKDNVKSFVINEYSKNGLDKYEFDSFLNKLNFIVVELLSLFGMKSTVATLHFSLNAVNEMSNTKFYSLTKDTKVVLSDVYENINTKVIDSDLESKILTYVIFRSLYFSYSIYYKGKRTTTDLVEQIIPRLNNCAWKLGLII